MKPDLASIRAGLNRLDDLVRDNPQLAAGGERWTEEGLTVTIEQATYSVRDAAELLGVVEETIRREIRRKRIKAAKIGRDYRISRGALAEYFRAAGGGDLFAEGADPDNAQ